MPIQTYQNFDLLFTRISNGYNARVINSPQGEVNEDFVLPFTPEEVRNFFWLSGRLLRHLRLVTVNSPLTPLTPKEFGKRLYAAVFTGTVGKVFLRSIDAVQRADVGLRIRLRLGDTPELADLPWEYLYATDLVRHPALSDQTPIVRYLDLPLTVPTMNVALPLRILCIIAAPTDLPSLNSTEEWEQLQTALTALQERNLIVLERLEIATIAALQRRLRQTEVHILHFIGHGSFDQATAEGGLLFENDARQQHLLSAERMATLLHDHPTLRLVFLNACEGARGGVNQLFGGVAQSLVQQGAPTVVAMQFPVSDQAAIALAQEFYRALADGYGVDAALAEARKAVYLAGDEREWGTPVLFSRSSDNYILAHNTVQESTDVELASMQIDDKEHGVSLHINNSMLTDSPIRIEAGTQHTPSDPSRIPLDLARSSQVALQLTQSEGNIRQLYGSLLALEEQQLLSNNKSQRATLQIQIDQQMQQLQHLLSSYVAQTRRLIWQIPTDIQAAMERTGVS